MAAAALARATTLVTAGQTAVPTTQPGYRYPPDCMSAIYCEDDCDKYKGANYAKVCAVAKKDGFQDLWEQVQSRPEFSTFSSLLNSTGVYKKLAANDTFIAEFGNVLRVYAPTNDAFDQVPHSTWGLLQKNPDMMRDVMRMHVVKYDPDEGAGGTSLLGYPEALTLYATVGYGVNERHFARNDACPSPAYLSHELLPGAMNGEIVPIDGVVIPCKFRNGTERIAMATGGIPIENGNEDLAKFKDPLVFCKPPKAPSSKLQYFAKTFDANKSFPLNLGNGNNKVTGAPITEIRIDSHDEMENQQVAGRLTAWTCVDLKKPRGIKETRCVHTDGTRGDLGFTPEEGVVESVSLAYESSCGGRTAFTQLTEGVDVTSEGDDSENWGCKWDNYTDRIYNVQLSNITTDYFLGNALATAAAVTWDLKPNTKNENPITSVETFVCLGWTDEKAQKAESVCEAVGDKANGEYVLTVQVPRENMTVWAAVRQRSTCTHTVYSKTVVAPPRN